MTTNQEIFDTVAEHLLTQGMKCVNSRDECLYRHDGMKCAVGCLIPDELYFPELEAATPQLIKDHKDFSDIMDESMKEKLKNNPEKFEKVKEHLWLEDENRTRLLQDLQAAHDSYEADEGQSFNVHIKYRMEKIAREMNLNFDILSRF